MNLQCDRRDKIFCRSNSSGLAFVLDLMPKIERERENVFIEDVLKCKVGE